jgi:hypothetical protein
MKAVLFALLCFVGYSDRNFVLAKFITASFLKLGLDPRIFFLQTLGADM